MLQPFSTTQPLEIEVKDFPGVTVESNGIYKRISDDDQWKSSSFHLFDNVESVEGLTVYIKKDLTNEYSWTLHRLSHFGKLTVADNDIHRKWTLQSYKIDKLYESRDPYSLTASIDVVRWNKLDIRTGKMKMPDKTPEKTEAVQAKTKYQQEFEAPFIQRVILKYKQKEYDTWNSVLCAPYSKFSIFGFHLKLNVDRGSKRSDHIEAKFTKFDMNSHQCGESPKKDAAYLSIDNLMIRSQTLGGDIDGEIAVFFNKMESCERWRSLYLKNIDHLAESNKKTKHKMGTFLKKELENELPIFAWILKAMGIPIEL